MRVDIPDGPGAWPTKAAEVIQIAHQRAFTVMSSRSVGIEVTYETLDGDHNRRNLQALHTAGYDSVVPESETYPDERQT